VDPSTTHIARGEGSASDESQEGAGEAQRSPVPTIKIGVLALQGAFGAHEAALNSLGEITRQVRTPAHLGEVDALVMPGGESTTMSRLLATSGLFDPLAERIAGGMPVFGTCAGMILLATEILDGRPDQRSFAAIDIAVRRNGYGRQIDSFETDIDVAGLHSPFHAVFIRAPKVESVGDGVEVLAEHEGIPVLASQGTVFVASFHPELTGDARLHAAFMQAIRR
jgi:5'-phosphate synthase pdxT subunit